MYLLRVSHRYLSPFNPRRFFSAVAMTTHSFFVECAPRLAEVLVFYLFGQVLLHFIVATVEVMILSESSRGPILEVRSVRESV